MSAVLLRDESLSPRPAFTPGPGGTSAHRPTRGPLKASFSFRPFDVPRLTLRPRTRSPAHVIRRDDGHPLAAEWDEIAPQAEVKVEQGGPDRQVEDWIVSTLCDSAPESWEGDWQDLIGRIAPKRRRPKLGRGQKPAAARRGWARFRLSCRRGATVVTLTDESLVKERELAELAGDLLAPRRGGAPPAGGQLRRGRALSSWVVGTVAEVHRRCSAARGGALKLCGLRPQLAALFSVTGLARDLASSPTTSRR